MAIDEEGVRKAVRLFLTSIGENPDREGLLETPDRIARACEEIFSGLGRSPQEVLSKRFPVETDEMVLVTTSVLFSVVFREKKSKEDRFFVNQVLSHATQSLQLRYTF